MATNPQAAVIIIGNEILSGRTQDLNVAYIAQKLGIIGIAVAEIRIVADVKTDIITAIHQLIAKYDYIFTTGGIGPTHDDITSIAVAEAFNLPYELHPEAYQMLEDYYLKQGRNINPASKKMAYLPKNVKLLLNPVSGAPGFVIENLYVLPGIPYIMQPMLTLILPDLKHAPEIMSRKLDLLIGESLIAEQLELLQAEYPQVNMGSYPFKAEGRFATSLVLVSSDHAALEIAYNKLTHILQDYPKLESS